MIAKSRNGFKEVNLFFWCQDYQFEDFPQNMSLVAVETSFTFSLLLMHAILAIEPSCLRQYALCDRYSNMGAPVKLAKCFYFLPGVSVIKFSFRKLSIKSRYLMSVLY